MAKVRVNWGPLPEGQTVQLYCVSNTSRRDLYVIASDKKQAMSLACAANHIYSPEAQYRDTYSRYVEQIYETGYERLLDRWPSLAYAVEKRLQGTLHLGDDYLSVGDQVIE